MNRWTAGITLPRCWIATDVCTVYFWRVCTDERLVALEDGGRLKCRNGEGT